MRGSTAGWLEHKTPAQQPVNQTAPASSVRGTPSHPRSLGPYLRLPRPVMTSRRERSPSKARSCPCACSSLPSVASTASWAVQAL